MKHLKLSFLFISFQYFVFDFHMAPAMLFDKIITLTVSTKGEEEGRGEGRKGRMEKVKEIRKEWKRKKGEGEREGE